MPHFCSPSLAAVQGEHGERALEPAAFSNGLCPKCAGRIYMEDEEMRP